MSSTSITSIKKLMFGLGTAVVIIVGCAGESGQIQFDSSHEFRAQPAQEDKVLPLQAAKFLVGEIPLPWSQACSLDFSLKTLSELSHLDMSGWPTLEQEGMIGIQSQIWENFENHEQDVTALMSHVLPHSTGPNRPHLEQLIQRIQGIEYAECAKECRNVPLGAVYESFFASHLLQMRGDTNLPPEPIRQVFRKILISVDSQQLSNALSAWSTSGRNYGVAGRKGLSPEQMVERVRNASDVALLIDFMASYFGLFEELKAERDKCYSNSVLIQKGSRRQIPFAPKPYIGITEAAEIADPEVPPFTHAYERDQWFSKSSPFVTAMEERQLPLMCSISGNTNVHLWGLASLPVVLNAAELRSYLLALWATMAGDGGHSLQEVLSSAKEVGEYFSKNSDRFPHHQQFIHELKILSDSIAPIGSGIGNYYRDFFAYLQGDPKFSQLREHSHLAISQYWQTHCIQTTE